MSMLEVIVCNHCDRAVHTIANQCLDQYKHYAPESIVFAGITLGGLWYCQDCKLIPGVGDKKDN